jgi:hypothetical protein
VVIVNTVFTLLSFTNPRAKPGGITLANGRFSFVADLIRDRPTYLPTSPDIPGRAQSDRD